MTTVKTIYDVGQLTLSGCPLNDGGIVYFSIALKIKWKQKEEQIRPGHSLSSFRQ